MGESKVTKLCTKCSLELELEKFNKAKLGKHGREAVCRCCRHKEGAAYREANKENILDKSRKYYAANRAEICKRSKQHKVVYRAKHKEEISLYNKEYAKLHKRDPQVVATNRQQNYLKNIERERARDRAKYRSNPAHYIAIPKKWKTANPLKAEAHRQTHEALRKGLIFKQHKCQICGNYNTEAHHEDYSKPLGITWLCITCHRSVHRKYNRVEVTKETHCA